MRFVLDASIALCWCFEDEQSLIADQVFERLQDGAEAIVPTLWWFEIRNAVTFGIRKSRIDEPGMDGFFLRLSQMIILIANLPETKAVFKLAHRHRLTFYDACYLELAQREGITLATLDKALAAAAKAEGIALIGA